MSEVQLQIAGPMPVGASCARVDRVHGACRTERAGLIHCALVGGDVAVVFAEAQWIGRDRFRGKRPVDFLPGVPGLIEPATGVLAIIISGGAKACVDAAYNPSPIVSPRCWPIGIISVSERRRRQHACLEGAVLIVSQ